jgi:hypothetical protein
MSMMGEVNAGPMDIQSYHEDTRETLHLDRVENGLS